MGLTVSVAVFLFLAPLLIFQPWRRPEYGERDDRVLGVFLAVISPVIILSTIWL